MKLEAENHRKMGTIIYNKEPHALVNSMESYFKERPPDCSLFSQDNFGIPVHKEVLYQTPFLRRMIRSFNMDSCCSKIEILCPSLSSEDLGAVVQFLYSGKISRYNSAVESKLSNILTELFGFPSIDKNGDSKQSIILEPIGKKKKMSSNSNSLPVEVSIKEEPEEYDVSDTDKNIFYRLFHLFYIYQKTIQPLLISDFSMNLNIVKKWTPIRSSTYLKKHIVS